MERYAEINEENIVLRVIVCRSAEWAQQRLGGQWLLGDGAAVGMLAKVQAGGVTFHAVEEYRTLVVPAAQVALATALATGLSAASRVSFDTPLSASGELPATHFSSAGLVSHEFLKAVVDAQCLFQMCNKAGAVVSLEACVLLVLNADVSDEDPQAAAARLGLQVIASQE